jgi:prefoldin alpha subunit
MADKQEMQQKYMEFQLLDTQLKQTQKQMQLLEEQLVEIMYTQQSLDEISRVAAGTEILVPVNNGIFARAKIENANELIVNVGAATAVPKTIGSTREMLAKQLEEVQRIHDQMADVLRKVEASMRDLEHDLVNSMHEE